MTDEKKDLNDLDLDEALAEWETDLEKEGVIKAESPPMPQSSGLSAEQKGQPRRRTGPLYRPPSSPPPRGAGPVRPPAVPRPPPPAPPPPVPKKIEQRSEPPVALGSDFDFDDDAANVSTRIQDIDAELIDQLTAVAESHRAAKAQTSAAAPGPLELDDVGPPAATAPPPKSAVKSGYVPPPPPPAAVEDDMLSPFDDDGGTADIDRALDDLLFEDEGKQASPIDSPSSRPTPIAEPDSPSQRPTPIFEPPALPAAGRERRDSPSRPSAAVVPPPPSLSARDRIASPAAPIPAAGTAPKGDLPPTTYGAAARPPLPPGVSRPRPPPPPRASGIGERRAPAAPDKPEAPPVPPPPPSLLESLLGGAAAEEPRVDSASPTAPPLPRLDSEPPLFKDKDSIPTEIGPPPFEMKAVSSVPPVTPAARSSSPPPLPDLDSEPITEDAPLSRASAPAAPPTMSAPLPAPPPADAVRRSLAALREASARARATEPEVLPSEPAPSPRPSRSPSEPPGDDQGALAAKRTVRYRKPREEHFPLVGREPEAIDARLRLLRELADGAKGAHRCRLLVAAAELAEQLGLPEGADLWRAAYETDPMDLIALRAARRAALSRQAWPEVAKLLSAEAALPLSPADRSLVLTALAEVQLQRLSDPAAAAKSAEAASAARPESLSAALLLAETTLAKGDAKAGIAALEKAAPLFRHGPALAAALSDVAHAAERSGDAARALDLHQRAAEADPQAVDVALGIARTARRLGRTEDAVMALRGLAASAQTPAHRETLLRAAAMLLGRDGRPEVAVDLLAGSRTVLALRTRSEAAAAAGDREAHKESVRAWAAASGGTERALALVELAEALADDGDLDGAHDALRDAALADESLGIIRVVREVLARKGGDASALARAVETGQPGAPGGALVAAAKLARDGRASGDERDLLARAVEEGESPVCADVILLDNAAGAGDRDQLRAALRRRADRATGEQMVGPLLSLARAAREDGYPDAVEPLLREAREVAPGMPLVLRPLARVVERPSPIDAAALWLEECSSAIEDRAAFAAMQAARVLASAGGDAVAALRRALDARRTYLPAAWALEAHARHAGDVATLRDVHERLAELGDDPGETAGHLVRAALLRAGEDPHAAAGLLVQAGALVPEDAIIQELLLRLAEGTSPGERAKMLEAAAAGAPPALARASLLLAAGSYEDAGEAARAAEIYRRVVEADAGDAIALHSAERAELLAGEHARVGERRMKAYKAAQDDAARVLALESLSDLDLYERQEPASAVLSLQAILELSPGHLPSLRALERYFMAQNRSEDLLGIEERLVEHLPDPVDVAPHARLAARLHLAEVGAAGEAADAVLRAATRASRHELWLARHLEAAESGTERAGAALAVAELLSSPAERASALTRAAEAIEVTEGPAAAAATLRKALDAAPEHPFLAADLARLHEASSGLLAAADAYEAAARTTAVPRRAAAHYHRAAVLYQEHLAQPDRALAALQAAADKDVAFGDVFARLEQLLGAAGDSAALAELTTKRLAAGGEGAVLVDLHMTRSRLCEGLNDVEGAKQSLRAALALEPERADALKRLAELSLADQDFRGAAEALIKIARLRKDREELRWVFFTLGDIYDRHMPDGRRAEAAYRRVLKLVPDDVETMDRLASLYRREGNMPEAIEMLGQLAQREVDPEKNRDYRLALAATLEQQGDLRRAESVLEQTRRQSPTDLRIVRGLADFYERQNAQSALAMHLNRAVSDLRRAIETDPTDGEAWPGLVEVLGWRGRQDAARTCASAAAAVGVTSVELARVLDPTGGTPGAGRAAAEPDLDELLAPPLLTPSTRAVFRAASEAFDKVLPLDLRALKADRAGRNDLVRAEAQEIGQWFGIPEVQVWVTPQAPRVFLPIGDSPPAVLVGREVLGQLNERERRFLLARAIKIAHGHLSITVRAQPDQIATALAALLRLFDPTQLPPGFDAAMLDDLGKRLGKALGRRREELMPLVLEMVGAPQFDATRLGLAATQLGDRVALLAHGSVPAAVNALLRLAHERIPGMEEAAARGQAVRTVAEAWSLLGFAISDAYFEARHRVGLDRV